MLLLSARDIDLVNLTLVDMVTEVETGSGILVLLLGVDNAVTGGIDDILPPLLYC